jgi:site-specific DNA-adenine methylase
MPERGTASSNDTDLQQQVVALTESPESKRQTVPRPFLKWAGGKTQLADSLLERRPASFNTYHEPFVGSGAIFFRLYREGLIRRAVLADVNAELIDTYLAVRDHVAEVIRILSELPYSKEFYYAIRSQDPWTLNLPERAARMIYLNKTGYNGLYRVIGRDNSMCHLDATNRPDIWIERTCWQFRRRCRMLKFSARRLIRSLKEHSQATGCTLILPTFLFLKQPALPHMMQTALACEIRNDCEMFVLR